MKTHRLVIYVDDVRSITGRSESYARKIIAAIRKKWNKQRHEVISLRELCDYLSLDEALVIEHLKAKGN
jgi:hypothetical protein